jgi:transposase
MLFMTVGHVNVKSTIEKIQKEISNDKSVSPVLISSIELLIVVIQMLFDRQSMNSTNSSLSPSSDNKRRSRGIDKKKQKIKGKKSVGGQDGHTGTTLTQYEEVDEIVEIPIDRRTLPQGEKFKKADPETRQVIDLNIEFIVREYQAEVLIGADGMKFVAPFPQHITKAIQYGPSVKSFAVYMSQYQLIPYARVQEVFKDQFDLKISQGSLCHFNREAFEKLEGFEINLIERLRSEKVLNADETGIKIDTELAWAHVLCTPKLTFIYPHVKRGRDAMVEMGIIPEYKGVLVHDHWKPYLGYDCEHGLCNAHHLRELQWVIDFKKHKWAASLKKFLTKLNDEVDEYGGVLPEDIQKRRIKRYRELVVSGNPECPFIMPALGSGKKKEKQTKERNLLTRLRDYEDQVLLFMKNKDVPFTNNQAERDIRMIKVHQKVSGQFKSMKSARHFCRIRSYLMTAKKSGNSPYDKLNGLFFPED